MGELFAGRLWSWLIGKLAKHYGETPGKMRQILGGISDESKPPQTNISLRTLSDISAPIHTIWLEEGRQNTVADVWHGVAQLVRDTPTPRKNADDFNRASGIITDIANRITIATSPDETVPIPTEDVHFLANGVLESAAVAYETALAGVVVLRPEMPSEIGIENKQKAQILRHFHSAMASLSIRRNKDLFSGQRIGMPRGIIG